MKIAEFMQLSNEDKEKYFLRVFPSASNKADFVEHDVMVFAAEEVKDFGMTCEICGKEDAELIGTSDSREPKFCMEHYADINATSEFYKELGAQ
jgi:hypothetical protein